MLRWRRCEPWPVLGISTGLGIRVPSELVHPSWSAFVSSVLASGCPASRAELKP